MTEKQSVYEIEQANHNHLGGDILWYALAMPALMNFFSVYAIKLGATPLDLGLLSALPAIFGLLSTTLSKWWRDRYDDTVDSLVIPSVMMRLRLPLYALVPLLPQQFQVTSLIVIASLGALPMGVSGIIFLVLMREAVSDTRLTDLLSRRLLAWNLGIAASTLLLGFWLERAPFPINYQLMFLAGFAMMMVSLWHVLQVKVVNITPAPKTTRDSSMLQPWRDRDFRGLAGILGVLFVGFYAILPVIPLFLVNSMGASEGFIALYSMAELAGGAAMATMTNRLTRRFGNPVVIAAGMVLTGLATIILALAGNLYLMLPAALITGAAWTAVDISQFSMFSANTSPEDRASHTRAYYQVLSVAAFFGPLIGSTLANNGVDLVLVLLIGAGMRIAAGILTGISRKPAEISPAAA